jgi:RNA ligase
MTLHYEFPHNITLDEVRKIVDAEKNFIIAEKDGYVVANYVRAGNDVFPPVTDRESAIRRELRGLIFHPEGHVMSRRFHKFFNYGEREDLTTLDLTKKHVILEKLDGSMITPVPVGNGKYRLGTKMGITDIAMQAENFVTSTNLKYLEFIEFMMSCGITPIFEWCSRQQRIVIDYPEDQLILLALRHNNTGKYMSYACVNGYAKSYGIPVVSALEPMCNLEDFIAELRKREDIEGVIIQFSDGHMVKIKTDTYVTLHRAKSLLENEIEVVQLILENKIDDLIPLLSEPDKKCLEKFVDSIWHDVTTFCVAVNMELQHILRHQISRKDYALESEGKQIRTIVFSNWGKPFISLGQARDYVVKRCTSNKAFSTISGWLITQRWKETKVND